MGLDEEVSTASGKKAGILLGVSFLAAAMLTYLVKGGERNPSFLREAVVEKVLRFDRGDKNSSENMVVLYLDKHPRCLTYTYSQENPKEYVMQAFSPGDQFSYVSWSSNPFSSCDKLEKYEKKK